jgi:hypothetical protein
MTTHQKKKRRKKCQERKKFKFVCVYVINFSKDIYISKRGGKCEKEFFLSPYVKKKIPTLHNSLFERLFYLIFHFSFECFF